MRSRKEEGEEDKKDVYDITFDYITREGTLRLKKKKKKTRRVPFAKEQSSTVCKMGSCIE